MKKDKLTTDETDKLDLSRFPDDNENWCNKCKRYVKGNPNSFTKCRVCGGEL